VRFIDPATLAVAADNPGGQLALAEPVPGWARRVP